jgi:hypothetical protein
MDSYIDHIGLIVAKTSPRAEYIFYLAGNFWLKIA